jgi:hypothetical protein
MDLIIPNYCNKNNIVYILISGIFTNEKEESNYLYSYKNIIEVISYKSEGLKDIYQLRKDAIKITQNKDLDLKPRFKKSFDLIKFYLLYTNLDIVIIANSHGSLIIHGAILKLKMIIDSNLEKELNSNRISIITNGSPRYLPKELLNNNQIYNMYNKNDITLNNIFLRNKNYFKIPNFNINDNDFKMICDNFKVYYNYNSNDNIFVIKSINTNKKSVKNHVHTHNILILFNCSISEILFHYFFYRKKNINIKLFDKKIILIKYFLENNYDKNIIITKILFLLKYKTNLNLLDNRDLFQLFYLYNKDKIITKFFKKRFNDLNKIKDKLYLLLSYKDLLNLYHDFEGLGINIKLNIFDILNHIYDDIHDIFDIFNLIEQNYVDILKLDLNKEDLNEDIKDKLNHFSRFNREECIKKLELINFSKYKIQDLDDEIIISIYISLERLI